MKTTKKAICKCGNKCASKFSTECQSCMRRAHEARLAQARHYIVNGCPRCGSKMIRNTSMSGWWQCAAYGNGSYDAFAADVRRDMQANNGQPCGFQIFTE